MNAAIATLPRIVRFIGYLGIAAFAAWCLFSLRADVGKVSFAVIGQSWHLVLAAVALSLVNYVLRAARWHWYLKRLGHTMPLSFSVLTYIAGFAFTLSPGKLGEMIRASYYARASVPVRDVGAAFLVERLMDLIAVLLLAMLVAASSPEYRIALWLGALVVAIGLVLLMALPWSNVARSFETSRWPRGLTRACIEVAESLWHARTLLRPQSALGGFIIATVAWLAEGLGLALLASMLEPASLSVSRAVGIYAISTLAGAISFLPGGLGTAELVMAGLLSAHEYSIADALSITLLCRIVTLWFAVGLGWSAVFVLRGAAWQRPSIGTT